MPSPADAAREVTASVRRLLYVAAALVFLAGLQLFVFPLRTADYFAWTVEPPMTAVFLGAAYWASVGLEVAGARARSWPEARVAVTAVLVFTAITLAVTLLHLDRLHLGAGNPASARAVTWGWIAVYAGVPLLLVFALWRQARHLRRRPGDAASAGPPARALPGALRAVLAVLAVVLLLMGAFLLVAPETAATWWPWALTALTGRAAGAWLVGLGVAAAHARVENDVAAVRPLGVTGVAFLLLEGVALLRHGADLGQPGPAAAGFLAGVLLVGAAGGWILALAARTESAQSRQPVR